MENLNKVDLLVKNSMLRYFSMYPTRNHVLENLFFSHYEWERNQDGFFEPSKFFDPSREARIESFEENYPQLKNDTPESVANAKYQNMFRSWAAENIDLICKADFHYVDNGPKIPTVRAYPGKCLLNSLPPVIEIDWEWVAAANVFCKDALYHIRCQVNHSEGCSEDKVIAQIEEDKFLAHIKVNYRQLYNSTKILLDAVKVLSQHPKEIETKKLIASITDELLAELAQE